MRQRGLFDGFNGFNNSDNDFNNLEGLFLYFDSSVEVCRREKERKMLRDLEAPKSEVSGVIFCLFANNVAIKAMLTSLTFHLTQTWSYAE